MDICVNQGGSIEKGVHLLRHKSNENLSSYVLFTQKSSNLSPGMELGQATQSCQRTAIERGLKFGSKNLIPRSNLITFKCSFSFNYFSQHALSSPPSGTRAVPLCACPWPEERAGRGYQTPVPLPGWHLIKVPSSCPGPRLSRETTQCSGSPWKSRKCCR